MRVYLPATLPLLSSWCEKGEVAGPLDAFAVTNALHAQLTELADEEAEYAVTTAAAEASLELASVAGDRAGRRVVVVCEVSYSEVDVVDEPLGLVSVSGVSTDRIISVLVDTNEHTSGDGLPAGDPGDDELAWFAAQEISDLLA